ncbi:MAG: TrkH family potassium uptake protein [Candidatus Gastranaerophilales bacterium]|nr:TrkH family potassium uptake protein [Candidatus Gastranaerophilales bacterium]
MRPDYILSALAIVLTGFGLLALTPILVALYYCDYSSILPFISASIVSIVTGRFFAAISGARNNFNDLNKKEALLIVSLTWVMVSCIAAIPYLFYGFSLINALFEAVSGITTTGATILTNFSYPKTVFFWRAMSQWLGGMGIIILFIAVLPQFAVAGRQMFFAEVPGPTEEKITPRIRQTASLLWMVYAILTVAEIICLKIAGMPWFDSICNSLATISAGGFSPNPSSIMGYNNNEVIWVITFFMFLSGCNFALQYRVFFQGQFKALITNEEFKFYTKIFLVFSCFLAFTLMYHNHFGFSDAIRDAMFQIISIITSTGFASADFDLWANASKVLIFAMMFIGGSAGSAGGGIKVVRVLIIIKYLIREITQILHPRAVLPLKIGNMVIPADVLRQIVGFVMFYFVIFILSSGITSMIEENIVLGVTGSAATIGNIGPGFMGIGPMQSFNGLHVVTKIIYICNMLVGRLELIPFLAMLHVDFWKIKFEGKNNA